MYRDTYNKMKNVAKGFDDALLEIDDEEIQAKYSEFYDDVLPEWEKFGKIVQFKCCNNLVSHLRGNVYIQYESVESAIKAIIANTGRFYGGQNLKLSFSIVKDWKQAVCAYEVSCPKYSDCNFLHVYKNPRGEFPPPHFEERDKRKKRDNNDTKNERDRERKKEERPVEQERERERERNRDREKHKEREKDSRRRRSRSRSRQRRETLDRRGDNKPKSHHQRLVERYKEVQKRGRKESRSASKGSSKSSRSSSSSSSSGGSSSSSGSQKRESSKTKTEVDVRKKHVDMKGATKKAVGLLASRGSPTYDDFYNDA
eukprot:TRINITY_DN6244_c0_g3_i2.p1 TRINITY_DN6244_c0_g3~~TRINITY_DN6244_c0_g3_i2.p1  ORF type:complete len:314 (-),score=60.48 TRINITY_DN6244_c0_g3_i2:188-1129(-)